MKKILLIIFVFTCSITKGQQKVKCDCIVEPSCKDSIVKFLNDYSYIDVSKTINNGYDTYLFSNKIDTIFFVYYKGYGPKGKINELTKIIAPYPVIENIYKNWYGRQTDFNKIKLQQSDYWETNNKNFTIAKNRFDENWRIEIR